MRISYWSSDVCSSDLIAHDDPHLENRMQQAIGAIAQRRFADAETQLNDLVAAAPDWAETWNKRATLYYLTHRDAESVADIRLILFLDALHPPALANAGFAYSAHATEIGRASCRERVCQYV